MCLGVYLASESPLPTIAFDQASPAFHVAELQEYELPVRKQFSMPHVVYLGSSTQCGCGFPADGDLQESSTEDRQRDRAALADYVQTVARAGPAEIFVCWEGEYEMSPERRLELHAIDLALTPEWLEQLTFVTVAS